MWVLQGLWWWVARCWWVQGGWWVVVRWWVVWWVWGDEGIQRPWCLCLPVRMGWTVQWDR